MPRRYSGEGEDVSPPLEWSGLPEGTREVALICDESDAPMPEPFVHWVVYKISANSTGFPEGNPEGALEGRDCFAGMGYGGPMPPEGHGTHHYYFKVYAGGSSSEVCWYSRLAAGDRGRLGSSDLGVRFRLCGRETDVAWSTTPKPE